MITTWYFTASTGLVPAGDWPVIIPGRLTMPTTIIALIVGIESGAHRLADRPAHHLPPGRAQGQQGLDLVALAGQLDAEPIEAERDAVERVAQDHPQERNGVLRRVPRADPHDRTRATAATSHGLAQVAAMLRARCPGIGCGSAGSPPRPRSPS